MLVSTLVGQRVLDAVIGLALQLESPFVHQCTELEVGFHASKAPSTTLPPGRAPSELLAQRDLQQFILV